MWPGVRWVGEVMVAGRRTAELFISRKAVGYHLGNILAKYGVQSHQPLRRLVGKWREPAVV
jgi:DNA-binding CsgD family transcriptional regulator